MRLFEMRSTAAGVGDAAPVMGIVLVTAETEEAALKALQVALRTPDGPTLDAGAVILNDLGLHTGPEEPGSVFVNGYRIAC